MLLLQKSAYHGKRQDSAHRIEPPENLSGPNTASSAAVGPTTALLDAVEAAPAGFYGAVVEPAGVLAPVSTTPVRRAEGSLGARRLHCATLFSACGFVFGHFLSQLPVTKERLATTDAKFALSLLGDDLGNLAALGAARVRPGLYRSSMPITGALVSAAAGAAAVSRRLDVFGASMLALGVASSLFDVAANVQMVSLEAASGRMETSLFHGLFSAGQLLGSAAGAAETWAGLPFNARVGGVTLALVVGYLGHWPVVSTAAPARREEAAPGSSRLRLIVGLATTAFLSSLAEGVASEWPGIYLRQNLHSSFRTANLAGLCYASGMTAARLLGWPLANRLGSRAVLMGGGALAAASMLAALVGDRPEALLLAVAAVGAGLANVTPLTVSAAGALPGDVAGAVAAVTLAQQLGFFSGPPIVGALSHLVGLRAALGVMPAMGAAIVLSGLVAAQRPCAQESSDVPGEAL